jgi:hypothetical protein
LDEDSNLVAFIIACVFFCYPIFSAFRAISDKPDRGSRVLRRLNSRGCTYGKWLGNGCFSLGKRNLFKNSETDDILDFDDCIRYTLLGVFGY